MSFKREESKSFSHSFKRVFDAVQVVCGKLNWKIEKLDLRSGRIEALVGMSTLSFGEKVSIDLSKIDRKSTNVHVASESYGSLLAVFKNPMNINKLFRELEKALSG